jgi:HD-GYP domain-containing protein (c-di-GMP phosphodiesterase class II)
MSHSNFLPVRISTLKSGVSLGFDLYIELPHKKLMYVRGNYDIETERISSLKDKKVRKLFIQEMDEDKYQSFLDRCLSSISDDSSIGTDEKADLLIGAGEATAERIYSNPETLRSYKAAANTSSHLRRVLNQNSELLKSIFDRGLSRSDRDFDSLMHLHSVNTATLCIGFAEYMGFQPEQVEILGLAGLYHDVAYGKCDYKELFFKPLAELDPEERKRYFQHPFEGKEYLADKEFVNPSLLDLIYSHEEKNQGNGFPRKLEKLTLEQEVLGIAAYYDRCLTCFQMAREEVFENFSMNELGNYNLETIKKFKAFIKKSGL